MKALKIVCALFFAVVILVTIVFFIWWGMKDRLVFGSEPFDQVRWITAAPTTDHGCHRGDMAYDLQQHRLLRGMPREAVTMMLGRPTWEDGNQIEYDLGSCLAVVHGLRLFFDDNQRLLHSRIVQH